MKKNDAIDNAIVFGSLFAMMEEMLSPLINDSPKSPCKNAKIQEKYCKNTFLSKPKFISICLFTLSLTASGRENIASVTLPGRIKINKKTIKDKKKSNAKLDTTLLKIKFFNYLTYFCHSWIFHKNPAP